MRENTHPIRYTKKQKTVHAVESLFQVGKGRQSENTASRGSSVQVKLSAAPAPGSRSPELPRKKSKRTAGETTWKARTQHPDRARPAQPCLPAVRHGSGVKKPFCKWDLQLWPPCGAA